MDKEQIRNEMVRVQMEIKQNQTNAEVCAKLEEEFQNLRREYAKVLFEESIKSKEDIKKSGKTK